MHRHTISRLSRRVELSTTSASSSGTSRRTFQSCAVRYNETGNGDGSSSARPPRFGNRWGDKVASKTTGLSAAERALRDALVARDQPKPVQQPESRQWPRRDQKYNRDGSQFSNRWNARTPSPRRVGEESHHANEAAQPSRRRAEGDTGHGRRIAWNVDWDCRSCGTHVEGHRYKCPSCHSPRAKSAPAHEIGRHSTERWPRQRREGDWVCPSCNKHVHRGKKICPACGDLRPSEYQPKHTSREEDSSRFREFGQSTLSEQKRQLEPAAKQDSSTTPDAGKELSPETTDAGPQEKSTEKDEEPKKRKEPKPQWSWDTSALEQLESLESPESQAEVQKKSWRRGGRIQRSSESDEAEFDPEAAAERREERKRLKQERAQKKSEEKPAPAPLYLPDFISVSNLADVIGVRPAQFVARMEDMGFEEVTYDHVLDAETAGLVAAEFNYEAIFDHGTDDLKAAPLPEDTSDLPSRPPVVTIMGHVDHGKTTILDWLRKSSVAATEHGGITQHIGAFSVAMPSGKTITFLDTPGHAAFLEMRRRGADVTDIVVLVVAADDSVKPQTIEAIKHAVQANVPIIVAMSKIDKEGCNPDKVKQDLAVHGVHVEDYGGDVQAIPVSGKTGAGMVELEEAIGALSEMLDHRAEQDCNVEGWVLEASTKSYGRVASALIRRGTLRPGDVIVAGTTWARVRTLRNEAGMSVSEATPGMPVEIDGWRDQPEAGEEILQAQTEQKAKDVVEYRLERAETAKLSEDMTAINEARLEKRRLEQVEDEAASPTAEPSGPKAVNFIVKADVDGSAEAVLNSITAIGNNEVYAHVIRSGVGPVSEFDIEHAAAANGKVISFNMPIEPSLTRMAEQEGVQIMDYNIIYKLIDDVKAILSEQLAPSVTHRVTGEAEIGQVFEITVKGRQKIAIAGCRVRNGIINKTRKVRVIRGNETVYDGTMTSLKNVKKDVTEMRKDTECGIGFQNWADFAVGDHVQCYEEIFEKRYL